MFFLYFIIIGLISGWLAAKVMNVKGSGLLIYLGLGVVGAYVGHFIFKIIGLLFWGLFGTLFSAFLGAVVVIFIVRLFKSRR